MLGKSNLAVQLSASPEGLNYMELQQQYHMRPSLAINCVTVEIVFEVPANLSLSRLPTLSTQSLQLV
jgi:predicted permease